MKLDVYSYSDPEGVGWLGYVVSTDGWAVFFPVGGGTPYVEPPGGCPTDESGHPPADGGLSDGVDTVFTYVDTEGVSSTLLTATNWNSDRTYYPREGVHGNDGAALTFDGTRIAFDLPIVDGYITATTAAGGSVKSGAYLIYVLINE